MNASLETQTTSNNLVVTSDPDRTLIIVSDDDKVYRLNKGDWQKPEFILGSEDPGSLGIVKQLTAFGSYLAFVDKNLAIGIGACCAVVNLRSVLKGAGVPLQSELAAQGAKPAQSKAAAAVQST